MAGRSYSRPCRGVTLLEVVLSMGLLVVLTSTAYWFYASVLDTRKGGTQAAQKLRLVRVVMNRIAREIAQATVKTADGGVGIRGEPERIWLSTRRLPTRDLAAMRAGEELIEQAEYDLLKVEYKIARHPEILDEEGGYEVALGLARVEIGIPRPDSAETGRAFEDEERVFGSEGEISAEEAARLDEALFGTAEEDREAELGPDVEWEELYAPEIRYLRFCYFDGNKWWDDWDITGENALPQLVMVTLGFEGHAPFGEDFGRSINEEFCECLNRDPVDCEAIPQDQYTMVVRVPQADPLFRSRISREAQAAVKAMAEQEDEEE